MGLRCICQKKIKIGKAVVIAHDQLQKKILLNYQIISKVLAKLSLYPQNDTI